MEGGYQYMKNIGQYGAWLRKIFIWNHLQSLEILLTFLGEGDGSFHYKSGFFKELLKVKVSFRIFQIAEGFAI